MDGIEKLMQIFSEVLQLLYAITVRMSQGWLLDGERQQPHGLIVGNVCELRKTSRAEVVKSGLAHTPMGLRGHPGPQLGPY